MVPITQYAVQERPAVEAGEVDGGGGEERRGDDGGGGHVVHAPQLAHREERALHNLRRACTQFLQLHYNRETWGRLPIFFWQDWHLFPVDILTMSSASGFVVVVAAGGGDDLAPQREEDEQDADVEGRGQVGQVQPGQPPSQGGTDVHAEKKK